MLTIKPIPAFNDNYIWHLSSTTENWIVDPGDAAPVVEALEGQHLDGILVTHHHWDHTGGIGALREAYQCPVIGPDSIPDVNQAVVDGKVFELFGLPTSVLGIPGHTLDHIALVIQERTRAHLFCGDTLFAAGCGRVFEGTSAQMHSSLASLAALPADTLIYCGHEYTEANLNFAAIVEPNNLAVTQRLAEVQKLRQQGKPSLPSSIAQELETNPFLRCNLASVRAQVLHHGVDKDADEVVIFAALRRWKDNF